MRMRRRRTSREIKRAGWGVIRKEQCTCKANDEAVASGGPFFGGILRGIGVGASRKEQQAAAAAAGTRGPKKKKRQRKKDNIADACAFVFGAFLYSCS